MPVALVEQVLGLYRDRYFDLNLRHFHEKLQHEHQIELSYTWVKLALQGAGLVRRGRKRGVHRQRRPRRPLPGMLLHIDGSHHRWFQDERWYDLIVILDDATSEIYYAQLVEEESTLTVLAALKEVVERKARFCAFYSDRVSHFFGTTMAGGPRRHATRGPGLKGAVNPDDPLLSAARARPQRAALWDLQGRLPQELRLARINGLEEGERLAARTLHSRDGRRFCSASGGEGA